MRIAAATSALLLSGCATIAAGVEKRRDSVIAEMKLVLPHITPAHLKECRERLEQPLWHGSKYAIPPNARLVPSLQHSCAAQENPNTTIFPTKNKAVVLVVGMTHVAGLRVLPSVQGCTFTLSENGKTIAISRAPTGAPASNICHYMR